VVHLREQGVTRFVELGPDGTLTALTQQALDDEPGVLTPSLRKGRPESESVTGALALLWMGGAVVDWSAALPAARRVALPTYAFQHARYWLDSPTTPGDVTGLGLSEARHPLLGAAVGVAGRDETLFTGRLSLRTHPWLADHVVSGSALLPGTALLELAARAAEQVGAERIAELNLAAPLVLPAHEGTQLQVVVGAPDEQSARSLDIHSRTADGDWVLNAHGTLDSQPSNADDSALLAWPPAGADEIDLSTAYERLVEHGYDYGPAFRGLRRLWRTPSELYAEIELPDALRDSAGEYLLHPAALDAALHALLPGVADEGAPARVPFAWSDVRVHAAGAAALRVRLAVTEPQSQPESLEAALTVADGAGMPVLSAGSLVLRPLTRDTLRSAHAGRDGLFAMRWADVPDTGSAPDTSGWAVVGRWADAPPVAYPDLAAAAQAGAHTIVWAPQAEEDALIGAELPDAARRALHRALDLVQQFLSDRRTAAARLVVVTRGAVSTAADEDVPDLTRAGLWGLLRVAQSENPDRVVLVDADPATRTEEFRLVADAVHSGRTQVAIRDGRLLAPRLDRSAAGAEETEAGTAGPGWDRGTVLVTGATGTLGALAARHLVTEHGARRLLLLSRRGEHAPGADALRGELEKLGAEVHFAACDVADRAELAAVLAGVPQDAPVCAVVHTAGVLDDTVIGELTAERLDAVVRPKIDAAWNLHELTRELPLEAFVLYSSIAGLIGNAGQANYAAGNAFLDALAAHRRAAGLPGTSVAWGLWQESSTISGGLSEADLRRLARLGLLPLPSDTAMELFDAAVSGPDALAAAVHLDTQVLRRQGEQAHSLLRHLSPAPTRRRPQAGDDRAAADGTSGLLRQLAALGPDERTAALADVVRAQAADVLGHSGHGAVGADRSFQELGFDSLTAVELRNKLNAATGLRLPSTVVFDYPTPSALAGYLAGEITAGQQPATADGPVLADLERTKSAIAAIAADDEATRTRVASTLRELLRLAEGIQQVLPDQTGDPADEPDLDSATDEELFALLDELD
ncbi:SDR family NAD(P)-dependent oxidoreductase, partial [Streptomyces sp. NPDC008086]|uniref:type I polyketide synthase n=1 Tax=Streptomyces sp. NPDC008086 TaxID=3364807 RepID=UPI0036E46A0B